MRKLMLDTMVATVLATLALLAILLPGCAGKPTMEQLAAMPGDTVVGYRCPFEHTVRGAKQQQARGEALGPQAQLALEGCKPITAAEQLAREKHLASCHLLSGNCAPREPGDE